MALQNSGAISLSDIATEFGGSTPHSLSEYYAAASGVPASGEIALDDFYGKSNIFAFNITSHTANANLSSLASAAGWDGSANLVCTINSGVWCYATSTGNYGLLVNVANATITNNGRIIGMGGAGGTNRGSGGSGGHALRITTSGVSITNGSGAYIAGGGGGGGSAAFTPNNGNNSHAGGGGGAGGGAGGRGVGSLGWASNGGGGGGLNASGSNGTNRTYGYRGNGGGAGGSGGAIWGSDSGGGGGGGRILPGSGGSANPAGGGGGSAGNNGANGYVYSNRYGSGGGGGWGANGGRGQSGGYGGTGGAAISATTSYTLSNSGTIYGAT